MKLKILLPLLALALLVPLAGQATAKKTSQNVYLAPDVIHQGNYYVAGNAVEIAGIVNGDVFAVGNSITISGKINGDVFSAASNIRISGQIDGSVRVAASNVMIEGKISRNVMAAGSNVVITESAEVGRNVMLAGAVVDARGKIGGNLEAAGNVVTVANEVGGNGYVRLDEEGKLNFIGNGKIKGDLDYTAKETMVFADGKVLGQVTYKPLTFKKPHRGEVLGFLTFGYLLVKLIKLFGLLVVGLVFISLARKKVLAITELMAKSPVKQIGQGVIWFFLTPIAGIILLFTVIGIPLALILFAGYAMMLYLGKVFAGITLGLLLVKAFKWDKVSLLVSMIIGVLALTVVVTIPFIGWLAGLVAIWWSWGAIIQIKKESLKE